MRENMRNLAKYVAHIRGINAAYAAYIRHTFPHISGICNFESQRIIIMIYSAYF